VTEKVTSRRGGVEKTSEGKEMGEEVLVLGKAEGRRAGWQGRSKDKHGPGFEPYTAQAL
jgi:hypothetical protein